MIVAGLMSGTSADGVDVALVKIKPRPNQPHPQLALLAHESFPYAKSLRNAVLHAMNAQSISAAELARLHWRLGEVYADALRQTSARHAEWEIELAGCHGQTVYHQARAKQYLGRPLRCTWQLGEPAVIAQQCGLPVVSDFRPADIAAGGQGAPLVPLLDYVLFHHSTRARVLQNLGGIGNLAAIAPSSPIEDVLAFDTGPANMLIDACMGRLHNKPCDRNGAIAAHGMVLQPVLRKLLAAPFFTAPPPKTAGREQFGAAYVGRFLALCKSAHSDDVVATATALTAGSIALAYQRFVLPHLGKQRTDFILSGGGARNSTLVRMLRDHLEPLGCKLALSDDFKVPAQAKEAMAFALLAWQTWHRLPGNVPSATGATRPTLLGKVTYA